MEPITVEELKATEDEHGSWHDGYCSCGPANGWKTTELYDIDHIIQIVKDKRVADEQT